MKITLKAARVNAGLTQKEAAAAMGVTKDTISNWERRKSFPSTKIIKRIEDVYCVPYDSIIFLPQNNALSVNREERNF